MPTSRYGFVSGPVWIDYLSCTGEESEIDDCPHIRWVSKSYGHSYDAAVYCIPPSCELIYVKLKHYKGRKCRKCIKDLTFVLLFY